MTRYKSFETAAARRRKNPIIWNIDGEEIKLVSSLDLVDLADLVDALQVSAGDEENSIRVAAEKRKVLLEIVIRFVTEMDQDRFRRIAEDLDIHILSEMVQDLIQEYSGAGNPTKGSSSPNGSSQTGETSTAGVQQEASTPSP